MNSKKHYFYVAGSITFQAPVEKTADNPIGIHIGVVEKQAILISDKFNGTIPLRMISQAQQALQGQYLMNCPKDDVGQPMGTVLDIVVTSLIPAGEMTHDEFYEGIQDAPKQEG